MKHTDNAVINAVVELHYSLRLSLLSAYRVGWKTHNEITDAVRRKACCEDIIAAVSKVIRRVR